MQEIKIEKMQLKHLDDVLKIENEAFSTPWSRDSFKMEITGNKCAFYIVACLNDMEAGRSDIVTGYGGMWIIIDECHITNIAVLKEYRGNGIGRAILTALIDEAKMRKSRALTLEVRAGNQIAQNLYTSLGFSPLGRRKGYYADTNEDAIIMWKYMR